MEKKTLREVWLTGENLERLKKDYPFALEWLNSEKSKDFGYVKCNDYDLSSEPTAILYAMRGQLSVDEQIFFTLKNTLMHKKEWPTINRSQLLIDRKKYNLTVKECKTITPHDTKRWNGLTLSLFYVDLLNNKQLIKNL